MYERGNRGIYIIYIIQPRSLSAIFTSNEKAHKERRIELCQSYRIRESNDREIIFLLWPLCQIVLDDF